MKNSFWVLILLSIFNLFIACSQNDEIHVLILSGSNNHNWSETTPFLAKMFTQSGLFSVDVTDMPDTLTTKSLDKYDVLVSNWNSWPENDLRWPAELETALLKFVEQGGGFVTFHASTSAFYNWPEFKNISTAAWIDETNHGKKSATEVLIQNNSHPITRGMEGFFLEDELWINAEKNNTFQVLGTATNKILKEKGIESQPSVMVKNFGKGKIFHTILGHDVRTMRNIGFQTLMLRGTEWAATGGVTQKIPQQLKNSTDGDFNWNHTDTTFTLLKGQNMIWQYNFNEFHRKPHFHPVYVGRNNITCVSPDDHPWHVGQWFSWKYLNGVNYWEYVNKNTYKSEGVTKIKDIRCIPNSDFSAKIELDIMYHPVDGKNVLAEKRTINISAPKANNGILMDYRFEFEALVDSLDINRTPIPGEPNGKSWGGYAGLSVRFNQDFMDSFFISGWGENDSVNGRDGDWLYMGFTGLDGNKVGSQIIISENTHRNGSTWYSVNTNDLPFYYFSPAYLYKKPLLLLKGEKLVLQYRINHFAEKTNHTELEKEFQKYKKELNQ